MERALSKKTSKSSFEKTVRQFEDTMNITSSRLRMKWFIRKFTQLLRLAKHINVTFVDKRKVSLFGTIFVCI